MFEGKFNVPPTSIRKEFGKATSRERLLAEILNEFEKAFKKVLKNPEDILNNWRSKCKMIGEKVKIINGDKEIYGVFDDIDENGFLLLKEMDGVKRVHSGDVSLR
jgi:BirA family biotin operon repressor/biotin-[acetyl-CoA-carboxylase] ligase